MGTKLSQGAETNSLRAATAERVASLLNANMMRLSSWFRYVYDEAPTIISRRGAVYKACYV
jgi:formate hydrogenlyase subunit 3/multisubunit Na+/H+ antiporter MnhD subunit